MSTDQQVTEDLIEVLEDGKDGFATAAEKSRDSCRPDLAPKFLHYSQQRANLADELARLAAVYGDDVDESGSAKATIHRAWMTVKDTLAGSDPDGILDAAEQGEDHAVEAYEDALAKDLSANLRMTVERQFGQIKAAHHEVRALRNAFK